MKSIMLSLLGALSILPLCSCHCEHDLEPKSPIKVGWVLCTDGTIMSLCDFRVSDKEAVGIVYHVNDNPEIDNLGYAVYIHDFGPGAFCDTLGVRQGTSADIRALDGNSNSYALYSTSDAASPIARRVFDMWSYGQSAHIPSVAEIRLLFYQRDFINRRIEAVGGDIIDTVSDNCWVWSSTEVSGQEADKAWLVSMESGAIQETPKNQSHTVRPVIELRNVMTL